MTPQTAALMAHYNRWMNERMYEAAASLDAATLSADRGAFFGSILGTDRKSTRLNSSHT